MSSEKQVPSFFYDVIQGQISTEKVSMLEAHSEYGFYVKVDANKRDIKKAVESCFNVSVERVRTSVIKGKRKMSGRRVTVRSDRKKAFVRLASGQVIDFENI